MQEGAISAVVELFRHVVPRQAAVGQALQVRLVQVDGGVNGKGRGLEKAENGSDPAEDLNS